MHVYIWYGNVWFRYVRVYMLHGHATEKRGTELLNWWNEPGVFKLHPRNHVDHLRCLHVCNHLFQRHERTGGHMWEATALNLNIGSYLWTAAISTGSSSSVSRVFFAPCGASSCSRKLSKRTLVLVWAPLMAMTFSWKKRHPSCPKASLAVKQGWWISCPIWMYRM